MTTPLEPGDVINGKYTVERVIGEGGMGIVVAAFHAELEANVAIKVLNEDVMANPQVVERFEREARAAVKIKSRHVARVTDVGKLDASPSERGGGRPFMVMEYLEGLDLEAVMLKEESLPIVRAVDYVLQACDAIAEAHAYGIVHRDLKPGNLFLALQSDGSKEIKVLDFGISKSTNPRAPEKGITSATEIFGSAMYMSPEQLTASANVDARADIWSLGVILYELLTGNPPFHEGTVAEIWSGILHKPIEKPTTRRPSVPLGLEKAIMKCLSRDLDDRYQHVADLAEAIAPFGTGDALACVDRAVRFRTRAHAAPESASGVSSGSFRAPNGATRPAPPAAKPAGRAPMASLNVDIDWDDPPAPSAAPGAAPSAAPGAAPSAAPGAAPSASPASLPTHPQTTPRPRPKSVRPPPAARQAPEPTRSEKARTTTDWQSVAPPAPSTAPSMPPPRRIPWPLIGVGGGVLLAVVITVVMLNARTTPSTASTGSTSTSGPITKPTSDLATLVDSPREPASVAASASARPRLIGRLSGLASAKASASPSGAPSAAPATSSPATPSAEPVDPGGDPPPSEEPPPTEEPQEEPGPAPTPEPKPASS